VHTENSIVIRAPLEKVFQTTANLLLWPRILPHYRWIRVLDSTNEGLLVRMAARWGWPRLRGRGWIPIQWTSRFQVDRAARELHFHHLKAFTRGMKVTWTYTPTPDGVQVRISHELDRWYAGLLARHFIHPVASQTLACFKDHLERGGLTPPSTNREALSSQRTPKS
jgi:uncharacterized membrane protein